jgi:8-oxo-dGTP diphosphatase
MSDERIVTAGIIRRDGSVLLARRSSGERHAGFWEFPGGKVEDGESPEECLERELNEELGIVTKIGQKCSESSHQYDHGSFCIVAYFVDCVRGDLRPKVHDRLEWVNIDDIKRYKLLPADIPIVASLQKLKELGHSELLH